MLSSIYRSCIIYHSVFFFFNDTATTEIYTLSLHDALPICPAAREVAAPGAVGQRHAARHPRAAGRRGRPRPRHEADRDRKSTRLNSSHGYISYAVFCLKKKKHLKPYKVADNVLVMVTDGEV